MKDFMNEQVERHRRTELGFWIYLMTDTILFASLFATYAVLRNATAGGPSGAELFNMTFVLVETVVLLLSSFSAGMALVALKQNMRKLGLALLGVTYLLGTIFLTIELYEFVELAADGHSWQASAFLSAFFVLVGTHGLHIFMGLLWLIAMVVAILKRGMSEKTTRQLTLFVMYWHFLDLIWIFIFTIVYLFGVSV